MGAVREVVGGVTVMGSIASGAADEGVEVTPA